MQLNNAFLHRKSFVTETRLHALEPFSAVPIVLSHESLWVDSALIPGGEGGDLSGLLADEELVTSGNGSFFDQNGHALAHDTKNGRQIAVVQKRVRVELTRGEYGVYTSSSQNLRLLIHEGISSVYLPVVEFESSGGGLQQLPRHLWSVQHMAGLLHSPDVSHPVLYLTAFFYCGRVGLGREMTDPTTDDVIEGVTNRYFTKELFITHMNDLVDDSGVVNFNISVSSTDDLTEGAHNKFFTQQSFDSALANKTIEDLSETASSRVVNANTMGNLHLSVGGVTELGLVPRMLPPSDKEGKLYIEQTEGQNVLFFEGAPVGQTTHATQVVAQATDSSIGEFHGKFTGQTRGVHAGDVIGNVNGFVSDLGNHPIITAKLLGNGEGHWVGTVNADMVGKFEGQAKIVTGSIDNASHLTIGTFDASSSIHVKSREQHLQISHTDGASVLLECISTSMLKMSCSGLQVPSVVCNRITCSDAIDVADINADRVNCVGITNNHYGIVECGRIEDVSEIVAGLATLSISHTEHAHTNRLSCNEGLMTFASVSSAFASHIAVSVADCGSVLSQSLSVANFHVENLTFDASIIDSSNLVFEALSASSANFTTLSGDSTRTNTLVVDGMAVVQTTVAQTNINTPILNAEFISVSSLQGTALDSATLSVQDATLGEARISTLSTSTHTSQHMNIHSAECNSLSCADLVSGGTIQAPALTTTLVTTEDLSAARVVTGTVSASLVTTQATETLALSVQSLTAATLSCGNSNILNLSVSVLDTQVLSTSTLLTNQLSTGDARLHAATIDIQTTTSLSVANSHTQKGFAHSLSANTILTSALSATDVTLSVLSASSLYSDRVEALTLSTGTIITTTTNTTELSASSVRAGGVTTHTLSADSAEFQALSVSNGQVQLLACSNLSTNDAFAHSLSAGILTITTSLSVSQATMGRGDISELSCSAVECDTFTSSRASIEILSISSLVGIDFASTGVTPEFVETRILSLSEEISNLSLQDLNGLLNLSCAQGHFDEAHIATFDAISIHALGITLQALSASEITVDSLSVATLHGVTFIQDLSVTGVATHISAASVTTADLSCGTIFIDSIVRSIPHISDTANPSVLTTSSVGAFSLFEEDAKHEGDMVIEGSLYVTDTIFMGSEPALRMENVQHIIAASISVGEIEIGTFTGVGGDQVPTVISNLLSISELDTIHEGNMQVLGNLLVSGVVLTGTANKLQSSDGIFEMDGFLSVSGHIVCDQLSVAEFDIGRLTGIGEMVGIFTTDIPEFIDNILSVSPHDTVHEGTVRIEGNLVVGGAVLTGTHNQLMSYGTFEMAGTMSIAGEVITSAMSIGEIAVGILTGIGGYTIDGTIDELIDDMLSVSPSDTVHDGTFRVDGNLIVSGAILTGTHIELSNEIEGSLSVQGEVTANGMNLSYRILELEKQIQDLTALVAAG